MRINRIGRVDSPKKKNLRVCNVGEKKNGIAKQLEMTIS